jgi:hypothetical protein
VFARRIEHLQAELKTRKYSSSSRAEHQFQYSRATIRGAAKRLILLMIPVTGDPALICPSFEVERIKRNSAIGDVRSWEAGRSMEARRQSGPRFQNRPIATARLQSSYHIVPKLRATDR